MRCAGVSPCGHELARIFVAQLVERERAALRRSAQRFGEQLRRIEPREPRARAQVALAVRIQPPPASASVTLWRIAVIASCSARRARTCMCTSPAAVSGRPSAAPSLRHAARRARSRPSRPRAPHGGEMRTRHCPRPCARCHSPLVARERPSKAAATTTRACLRPRFHPASPQHRATHSSTSARVSE